jgi:hypothetical protein
MRFTIIVCITQEYNRRKSITLKHWNMHWATYIGYKNNTLHEPVDKKNCIKKRSFSYGKVFLNPRIKLPKTIVDIQLQLDQRISVLASLSKIGSESIESINQKLEKEVIELAKVLMRIAEITDNSNQEVANG